MNLKLVEGGAMKKENTQEGYIQLSRSIRKSDIWELPPLHLKVWIWLLCRAVWKPEPEKRLKRGQCLVTIPETIEAMKYFIGYRCERPTKKQIWGIYEGLRERDMIVTTKVTRGMIVTICNYDFYQDAKNYEGNGEGTMKVTRREQQGNTREKKEKKEKNKLPALPQCFDSQKFRTAFLDFVEHRKSIKKPMTEKAMGLLVKNLEDLSGGDGNKAVAIMEQSIINGWQGVFELKDKQPKKDEVDYSWQQQYERL